VCIVARCISTKRTELVFVYENTTEENLFVLDGGLDSFIIMERKILLRSERLRS